MADQPIVHVQQGAIQGTTDRGMQAFLGIPYAAAPFDDLRMKPPAPPVSWDGVRDASQYGPTVPKGDYPPQYQALLPEVTIEGDECLNLNVWTPDPTASGLPVYVWIHGGSFMNGSGSIAQYAGTSFARDGVVCVTINYRLGAEGFLYTPGETSNLGLLDQVAALEWVRDNIAAFGGDPAKVTVGGESAGAMSVTTLLSMPRANGLFRSAIIESGAAAHTMSPQTGDKVTGYLAELLGVEPTRAAIAALPRRQVFEAAAALTNEVQTTPDPAKWGEIVLSLLPFMPTVDGEVLPASPIESIAGGQGADVSVLIGTNLEESRLFLVAPGVIGMIDEQAALMGISAYGAPAKDAYALYGKDRAGAGPGDILAAVVTDWFFRVPAIRVAEARGGDKTWMYRFDWRSPAYDGRLGSAHAVEIPFAFDTLDSGGLEPMLGATPPQEVANTMHDAWVKFITDGDPGWSAYDVQTRATQIFGDEPRVESDPNSAERQFWDGIR
ncbi:para-nitrobenzyl esterase [Antricoccus suffuscus]|uniref:Carboxylic ester hydrolase n=1 Tax=Antricoccus suffuscus TaxID=1629062 RepID=A0A2T1A0V7_9ACTN|nr:carboxylesterase/lipase family protein [Antricoccus suffuscus]PRZ42235.1 para-nitrobenzyl esterase [Antricoccus suffuscus]